MQESPESNLAMMTEVIREAESMLAAQLSAALASDQRALVFAGLLAATTAAIASGGIALILQNQHIWMGIMAMIIAGVMIIAVGLAMYAARPIGFEFSGNRPREWAADILACRPLADCLREQAEHYNEMIDANLACMKQNGQYLKAAMLICALDLAIGGAIFVGLLICLGIS